MKNLKEMSLQELLDEYELCSGDLWSKYSCDCLGFYLTVLLKEIYERNK